MKTDDRIIKSIITEILERGGFENLLDMNLTLTRILSTKFGEIRSEAEAAGVQKERAACVEMLREAIGLYQDYREKALEQQYKPSLVQHPAAFVSPHDWFAKITAIEYAILCIEKWRESEHFKPGHLPMPF